jgi:hypothetical protein
VSADHDSELSPKGRNALTTDIRWRRVAGARPPGPLRLGWWVTTTARIPFSTGSIGSSALVMSRKTSGSTETRLTVTRWSPAWASYRGNQLSGRPAQIKTALAPSALTPDQVSGGSNPPAPATECSDQPEQWCLHRSG